LKRETPRQRAERLREQEEENTSLAGFTPFERSGKQARFLIPRLLSRSRRRCGDFHPA
jgi:hypothetical protein